ncbi:MAG: ABC transporter substrate-binding protein [Pseudomonadota bacterium]
MNKTTTYLMGSMMAVMIAAPAFAGPLTMPVSPVATPSAVVSVATATQNTAALNFVTRVTQEGLAFLEDTSLSQAQKKAKFRSLLTRNFDLNTIGRFALGTNWRVATPAEQQQYLKLFSNMVVEVYATRFDEYEGEKVQVQGVQPLAGSDSLVTSYIVPAGSGQKVRIDWRIRHNGSNMRVVDVIVEGVSMSVTQRAEFASIIQQGGGKVSHLIQHLQAKVSGKSS